MVTAALLHGEIDSAAIGCPMRRALAIVDHAADFAAIAAIGIHDPDVRVFHGGLAVGEAATRAAIDDGFSVRRPQRIVFVGLGCGQTVNAVVGELQREEVVVKEFILIRLAIGSEHELLAVGRPVDGMLVIVALGELAHLLGGDIHHENMQALIVVEAREPFACVGLVEIARNHHGIAIRFGGAFARLSTKR